MKNDPNQMDLLADSEQLEIDLKPETNKKETPVTCLGITFPNDNERRQYFTDLLREKLKDPEFRKIEGFPIGKDEDILALSDPPYFTACPNPFFEEVGKKYCSFDHKNPAYKIKPLASDVSEGKHDPIYKAHTYHTKVPPKAICKYISHYTKPGDLILDPYCGSGMTGLAANLVDGRYAFLSDLSPAASHIAAGYTRPWNRDIGSKARRILENVRKRHLHQFQANENGNRIGEVKYWVWSDILLCDSCLQEYSFADVAVDLEKELIQDSYNCPHCNANQSKSSANYAHETIFDPFLKKTISVNKRRPFWIVFEKDGKRLKRKMNAVEIEESIIANPPGSLKRFEVCPIMFREGSWGCLFRSGYHFGITHSHQFYTHRVLMALDDIWDEICRSEIEFQHHLRFWFMATAIKCSKLMNYNADGIGRVMKGSLYISSLTQEVSPFHFLEITLRDMESAMIATLEHKRQVFTSCNSAQKIPMPNESIDYVFIDPPFGNNLIYSELNFLWECWLKVFTNEQCETIVNSKFGKDIQYYTKGMTRGFSEVYRVLKAGHWMTVEFHNSKNAIWTSLQQALEQAGFVIADVRVLDKKHGSIKQVQTAGAVKQDLIITAYKPNGGLEERFKLEAGTEDGVWDFVRTHLRQLPVFVEKNDIVEIIAERQNYLIFDRMVAFHIQRGVTVPISASEFYAGLQQRFAERDSMFFLPEQAIEYDKLRVNIKGIEQLSLFVSDEATAIQWLRALTKEKPQTFQELHPQFLQEISGWNKWETPIELSLILEQNFLCFDGSGEVPNQIHSYLSSNWKEFRGLDKTDPKLIAKAKDRWYVPDPNKAGDIEKLREKALLREFDEYKESKKKLKVFRLEAVRAGFKKAWQDRDYVTIISVAEKIPADVLEEDPKLLMWYDQAVTRKGDQ